MKDQVQKLKKLAEENGLHFEEKSWYHFHLRGHFLLNVYPTKRTYYIQGTNSGGPYRSLEELVKIAKGEKNVRFAAPEDKTPRKNLSHLKKYMWPQKRACFVCGVDIVTMAEATIEHKIPLSRGGSNRMDNLALSHEACNHRRGNELKIERELLPTPGLGRSDVPDLLFKREFLGEWNDKEDLPLTVKERRRMGTKGFCGRRPSNSEPEGALEEDNPDHKRERISIPEW